MKLHKILIFTAIVLSGTLTGCRSVNFAERLHNAHVEIMDAAQNDINLRQQWMNRAAVIAVELAEEEATYLSSALAMHDIKNPNENWWEEYQKIKNAPTGYEGGSVNSYVISLRSYDMLIRRINELQKVLENAK